MKEKKDASGSGESYQMIQPHRDLEANWDIDVAKNLEDYLLKICSGEVTGGDNGINFAEAAMVIQNSIQVYSKKVEYLYSLVLNALEFINQQSQPNQSEEGGESGEHSDRDEGHQRSAPDDENDDFWVPDDIPVEPNITLKDGECTLDDFVKPPADLLVLEGDCLDANGEGGELESYMLAKCELYRDFLLLDPSDAAAVDEYLKEEQKPVKKHNVVSGGSSQHSHKSLSPIRQKGGSAFRSPNAHFNQAPGLDHDFDFNNFNDNVPQNNNSEFEMDGGYPGSEDDNDSDEDDPWKPLNPHEPGNLKVKPFKKVKGNGWDMSKPSRRIPITREFPLAPLHGPISSDLTQIWESQRQSSESWQSESPPLYEKLRQSLVLAEHDTFDEFKSKVADEDDGYDSENANFEPHEEFEMPENTYMNEDHDGGSAHIHTDIAYGNDNPSHTNNAYGNDDPTPDGNLEDLCHKHLDSLVANLNEIEEQTEMAARVSTWKQRIEQNLEEQDALPPFDIHTYGEKVLEKLSEGEEGEKTMSFTDVVKGQEKHDVARTFSALLQLVNNGNVGLLRFEDNINDNDKEHNDNDNGKERNDNDTEGKCYTGKRPFYVKLLRHKRRQEVQLRSSKKKAKSPATNTRASGRKGKSVK